MASIAVLGSFNMDLVVAHDLFMNDTIRDCADIVLPATSWLEGLGVKATTTHLYLMDRILEPAGETRSIPDVARALAERLGIEDFYPWHDDGGHIDSVLDHPATGRQGDDVVGLAVAHHPDPIRVRMRIVQRGSPYLDARARVPQRRRRIGQTGIVGLPAEQASVQTHVGALALVGRRQRAERVVGDFDAVR